MSIDNLNCGSGHTEKLLTIPQAARELGIPVSTLRRAVNAGEIPSHRPFNQRVRVRLTARRKLVSRLVR